jgi:hypothetical protein
MGRKRRRRKKNLPVGFQLDIDRQDFIQEQEILNRPGLASDPQVVALFAKMKQAKTNAEMLELSLQLQRIIRGDASLLESPALRDSLNRMRSDAHDRDKAEAAFVADREGFIESTISEGERHKLTGERAERVKVTAQRMLQQAISDAKAGTATKHLAFEEELRAAPLVKINVAGRWEHQRVGDKIKPVLKPEVVGIMHRTFVLQPGVQEVPLPVAKRYEEMQRGRMETDMRKALMDASKTSGMEAGQLELEMQRVDEEYGVRRDKLGAF